MTRGPRSSIRNSPSALRNRPGLTLLEVIISLAIFLFSLVAIVRLIGMGNERARDARDQLEGLQRCQSKLNEVVAGVLALQPQADIPYEDDSGWRWTLECTPAEVANLWHVRVTLNRDRADGTVHQVVLSQLVLDPTIRGGTAQANPAETTEGTTAP